MGGSVQKGEKEEEEEGDVYRAFVEKKRKRDENKDDTTATVGKRRLHRSSSLLSSSAPNLGQQKRSKSEPCRTFKLQLAPYDLRRFTVPQYKSWTTFENLLRSEYAWAFEVNESEERVVVRYEDESSDFCILSSQDEWDDLLRNRLLPPIVRLRIDHEVLTRPDEMCEGFNDREQDMKVEVDNGEEWRASTQPIVKMEREEEKKEPLMQVKQENEREHDEQVQHIASGELGQHASSVWDDYGSMTQDDGRELQKTQSGGEEKQKETKGMTRVVVKAEEQAHVDVEEVVDFVQPRTDQPQLHHESIGPPEEAGPGRNNAECERAFHPSSAPPSPWQVDASKLPRLRRRRTASGRLSRCKGSH